MLISLINELLNYGNIMQENLVNHVSNVNDTQTA